MTPDLRESLLGKTDISAIPALPGMADMAGSSLPRDGEALLAAISPQIGACLRMATPPGSRVPAVWPDPGAPDADRVSLALKGGDLVVTLSSPACPSATRALAARVRAAIDAVALPAGQDRLRFLLAHVSEPAAWAGRVVMTITAVPALQRPHA